jgi:hypothetical protein
LRPRQGECPRSTKIVLPVSHFLHQNASTAGWQDPKIKFSLKINSPYCILYRRVSRFWQQVFPIEGTDILIANNNYTD